MYSYVIWYYQKCGIGSLFSQAFNNKMWSMLIITLNKACMNKYDYTIDDSLLKIIYLTALRPIPAHTYVVFRTYTLQ